MLKKSKDRFDFVYFVAKLYPLKKLFMKKIVTLLTAMGILQLTMAQQSMPTFINNPFPKTISVTGSAELEIIPDEIYVNIGLSEYQKKGENKKDIELIKSQFLEYCRAAGIADSAISIAAYSGAHSYYDIRKKKKNTDLLATITYQVKFRGSKLMDNLVEKLDDDATKSFVITSVSHSKIQEYRRQLKIKAIQAAREKGIYLTEAIGEKLAEAITIQEPGEYQPIPFNAGLSNMAYSMKDRDVDGTGVDFKKMKLRFEVSIVFAIK
jgi:uncharacterized protein YggE